MLHICVNRLTLTPIISNRFDGMARDTPERNRHPSDPMRIVLREAPDAIESEMEGRDWECD